MIVDKKYCMNSYLMFRYVVDDGKWFCKNFPVHSVDLNFERHSVRTAEDLYRALKYEIDMEQQNGKIALALSGGIDSAILAKMVPKGTKAYTFRCIVPGMKVIDETEQAAYWAKICSLDHKIIDIRWKDIEFVTDKLMKHKGAPIHSIEAQIYLAAQEVKKEGGDKFIFGENADIIYGGMDGLLKKDWYFGEFVERYAYILPYKVLRNPEMIMEPFLEYEKQGHIDGHDFINQYFRQEALGTYINACKTAEVEFVGPYSKTKFEGVLDYQRIRSGDTKYLIRELFKQLYPGTEVPEKIPLPRPMNEWFSGWGGPVRREFIPHCTDTMSGDQKWMVWCLERFLNTMEEDDASGCDRTCG